MEKLHPSHYSYMETYDTLERFINYYYQVSLARQLKVRRILEVGIGNKTVSNYLLQQGFEVTTCDHDESLRPDLVADIKKLPLPDDSYDVILACEILEHLPWEDVIIALSELNRVTRRYVIVSVPYSSVTIEFIFASPLISKLFKRQFWELFFRVPMFFKRGKIPDSGGHYWEMGRRNYPIRKIRKALKDNFDIVKEVRPPMSTDLHNYFFILQTKNCDTGVTT